MAPNRKSPTLFANNLESLNIPLKAEFLPLTDPREAAQHEQQKCVQHDLTSDPKTEKTPPAVSYWDWEPDTVEEEKLAAIDDLFSLSRFESNLIADSMRRESSTANHVPVDESEVNNEQTEGQHSYWDWSNNGVDVVEPETDSQDEKSTQIDERYGEECCDDYWSWHPNEETEDHCHKESPSDRLHQVLTDSQKKFVRRHSHLPEPGDCEISKSHHYWHWLECREK